MRIVRGLLIASAWALAGCGSSITAGDSTGTSVKDVPPAPVVFGASISGDCVELFPLASGASGELTRPDLSGEDPPLKLYGGRTVGSVVGSLFRMGPGYRFVSVEPATDVHVEVIDDEWLLVESPGTQGIVIRVQSDGAVMACDVGLPTMCEPDRSSAPISTVPAPVVFRLEVAGDCYRLVELTEASPPDLSCPRTTRATPILPYETRTSGETTGEVLRLGDGYRLDSIRFAPDLRLETVDGGWILAEGLAYGTSVARVMNDTETLDCVLDLVVDCTPVDASS